ncbi:subclass B1 metallo-beta-lactamase [Pontibacter anaerobius]|uniref:beta-lactamase n=1 Tax=Pontibacter anaerobius TaxID=2993940 RepID=A0ABT3RFB8_9BACT|nr:subclass B1 metallo-beta-lactamase [Pontibacter anaerobius]MCX2740534.1 subclass B1 metallo-beta-lactamase [Pontibacter anaerobius]
MKGLLLPLLLLLLPAFTLRAQEQPIQVTKIAPKVYVHTSFQKYNGVLFPSHGLLVSTNDGVVLIDTGWGNEPTEQLLAWVKTNLKQPVKVCVPTHWHDDKMGGIGAVQAQGIPVVTSELTATLAAANGKGTPDITFATDTTFTIGKQKFEVYFPGGGHTLDNVVVYLPQQKILFGGCFVKDTQAKNLGNTADADLESWPVAIQHVQQRYPKAKVVVPSHGPWGNRSLLSHTLELLQDQK